MKKKHLSIGQRIQKTRNPETQHKIVLEWAESWEKEQSDLIATLARAVAREDFDGQRFCVGDLRTMTKKRFEGLKNLLSKMIVKNETGA